MFAHIRLISARTFRQMLQIIGNNKLFFSVFLTVLLLRHFLAASGPIVVSDDTVDYFACSQASWWRLCSSVFFNMGLPRPCLYPLLIKLCHFNISSLPPAGGLLFEAQVLIGIVALALIGLAGCRLYTRPLARITWLVCFFCISVSSPIFPWEPVALSDGPGSVGVIVLLALVLLATLPEWGTAGAIATGIMTTGFMFLRDSNIFTGLIIIVCLSLNRFFANNRPRFAVATLKENLLRAPGRILHAPLFILSALLILGTVAKYRDLQQHTSNQDLNLTNFVAHRVMVYPQLQLPYLRMIGPPPEMLRQPQGAEAFKVFRRWIEEHYKARHLQFLLANPGAVFTVFNRHACDILSWLATTSEGVPNAYHYLYRQGRNPWNSQTPNWRMRLTYRIDQWMVLPIAAWINSYAPWPFFLPLALVVAALLLRLKLGMAQIFPALAFLAGMFYTQYGLSIFFEGVEDYRHALSGTTALILMPWLFLFASVQAIALKLRRLEWKRKALSTGEKPAPQGMEKLRKDAIRRRKGAPGRK